MSGQSTFEFQWFSTLGICVVLFILNSLVLAAIGILTPIALRRLLFVEPAMRGHFLFSPDADTAIFGQPPIELYKRFPYSKTLIEMWGLMLSAFMLAFAFLQLGVAWFGLRAGKVWAFWLLVVSNSIAIGFYWLLFVRPYAAKVSLRFADLHPFATVPTIILPIAALLGWIGLT